MADPLSNLGQVLMGAAQDYATNKRQDDREARVREERLADVQSARQYETAARVDQQTFAKLMQDRTVQNDIKLQLIHEGLLAPGDIDKPEAIFKAFNEAKTRGLDVLYRDLMTTPDANGAPLLNRADLSDPAKIEAAKQKLNEIKSGVAKFQLDQPKLAQDELTRLNTEGNKVQSRLTDIEQKLSEPQPTPDVNQATRQAIQNIRALKKDPKYTPSQAEIESEISNVIPQLQARLDQQWFQNKQDAQVQYQTLHARLQDLSTQRRELESKFGVAPRAQPPAPVAAPVAQPTSRVASPEQQAAALAAVIRGAAKPAAAASTPAVPFAQTFNDPVIQQANTRATQSAAKLQADAAKSKLDSLLSDIQSTDQNIQIVQQRATQPVQQGVSLSGMTGFSPTVDPNLAANALSRLHQRKAALQTEYDRLKSQLLGPQAGVTPVQTNTSSFVQPQGFAPGANDLSPAPFNPSNLMEPAY